MDMLLLQQAKEPLSLEDMMALRSPQLLALTTLDGADWMTCNLLDVIIVQLSMAIKFMLLEERELGKLNLEAYDPSLYFTVHF